LKSHPCFFSFLSFRDRHFTPLEIAPLFLSFLLMIVAYASVLHLQTLILTGDAAPTDERRPIYEAALAPFTDGTLVQQVRLAATVECAHLHMPARTHSHAVLTSFTSLSLQLYCRIDALLPVPGASNEWDLVEVKSSVGSASALVTSLCVVFVVVFVCCFCCSFCCCFVVVKVRAM
jgi:hypothetical protein